MKIVAARLNQIKYCFIFFFSQTGLEPPTFRSGDRKAKKGGLTQCATESDDCLGEFDSHTKQILLIIYY